MTSVRRTAIRQAILVITFAIGEVMIFWFLSASIVMGILLGSLISVICFWLLAADAASFSSRRIRIGYVLRYALYAIILGSTALFSETLFLGTVAGVFNGKITIILFGRWLGETQSDPQ